MTTLRLLLACGALCLLAGWGGTACWAEEASEAKAEVKADDKNALPPSCRGCPRRGTENCPGQDNCPCVQQAAKGGAQAACQCDKSGGACKKDCKCDGNCKCDGCPCAKAKKEEVKKAKGGG